MNVLHFTVPPLPEYIISGSMIYPEGSKHPNRRNIGVFDLLVVRKGCLYVSENEQAYEITPGSFLILRPDAHHYPTQGCTEDTFYYWLHFHTSGGWNINNNGSPPKPDFTELQPFSPNYFKVNVPQFGHLLQPQKAFDLLESLAALVQNGHRVQSLWRQQVLFQELIEQLAAAMNPPMPSPFSSCAEQAAAYLREHYQEEFKAQALGASINFHPVYISRCMQKEFGCSPVEYLIRYRIEQAKLLLIQTDQTISRIAEDVGFNHAAYFTSCFSRQEGISPRKFRQQFS
ncbi:AraC family transcriptional regulator [Paenibacillus dakarensis]|uniref:AraC family transcriptional regulator n=1 Tax=Paenibacillus dakarensis TaxID=1527293 RepID=UPI0006D59895|nr:AraC family transcriptional regulator [Paenibacillus dakarensis]